MQFLLDCVADTPAEWKHLLGMALPKMKEHAALRSQNQWEADANGVDSALPDESPPDAEPFYEDPHPTPHVPMEGTGGARPIDTNQAMSVAVSKASLRRTADTPISEPVVPDAEGTHSTLVLAERSGAVISVPVGDRRGGWWLL